MRFTLVSVALLVLAQSVAPGVYGAPAVATNSLAARQLDIISLVNGLLSSLQKIVEQLEQGLPSPVGAANGLVPRALSSDAKSSTPSLSLSPMTPSVGLATTTVSHASSVSPTSGTPHASSTAPNRMRRQLPVPIPSGSFPVPIPSGSLPVPLPASHSSSVPGEHGSVTSGSATSKPSASASHV